MKMNKNVKDRVRIANVNKADMYFVEYCHCFWPKCVCMYRVPQVAFLQGNKSHVLLLSGVG